MNFACAPLWASSEASADGKPSRVFRELDGVTRIHYHTWLVVWNMNFMFPYIGNNDPN